jgi:hypothetical protein
VTKTAEDARETLARLLHDADPEGCMISGHASDTELPWLVRADSILAVGGDRWLSEVRTAAYADGYAAGKAMSHSLTPDDAYRAFCEARKGSPLVPGEYEAMFSRVEYAWLATAIKGGAHS